MKVTLHTAAVDRGPFSCRPAGTHELDPEKVLANDVTLPGDFNPHNTKLWLIGHEFGACCAVWADCEQDAFDIMVDEGLGAWCLIRPEVLDQADEDDHDGWAHLGNAGEPADLSTAWILPVEFKPERDCAVMCRFAEARGACSPNLDR